MLLGSQPSYIPDQQTVTYYQPPVYYLPRWTIRGGRELPRTLTVSVANNAPASVTNTATVSGGGESNAGNDTATDVTVIVPLILTPNVTQLSIKSALAGTQRNLQVSGTKLGATFEPIPSRVRCLAICPRKSAYQRSTRSGRSG